ncbi:MAG: HNH endonuclease [Gammaproteobacteria bacterium]|nr:HNH endonuclease [Gammaproteobacteria bacterium]
MKLKRWTLDEDRRLAELYQDHSAGQIGRLFGRSRSSIKNRVNQLGLQKTPEMREKFRRDGCFKKGATPWNKGKHFDPGGRSAETRFKPLKHPSQARNYKPIGSLRITKDGYLERKVTDDHPVPARRWLAVHRLAWEEANGPLPDGHIVRFKRGMKTILIEEITLDRLECISRRENMQRNTVHNYPAPIPQLIQLKGALQRQINKRERHEKQK